MYMKRFVHKIKNKKGIKNIEKQKYITYNKHTKPIQKKGEKNKC